MYQSVSWCTLGIALRLRQYVVGNGAEVTERVQLNTSVHCNSRYQPAIVSTMDIHQYL